MSTVDYNPNSRPVGFFDSGVGGLSVYSKFKKLLPGENTMYFGDLANLPYGSKSKEELVGFARSILDFYKTKNVKAVVIACNTSSAQAYDIIKTEYDFPVFPIIQSSAKVIAEEGAERIGVFATEATVRSGVYSRELKKYNPLLEVYEIACPNWVSIVETGRIYTKEAFEDINARLRVMREFKPQKIILGCTHYPYLTEVLQKAEPQTVFIDPADIFVEYIKNHLDLNNSDLSGSEHIYVSAGAENFMKHSKIFYNVKTLPEIIELDTRLCS